MTTEQRHNIIVRMYNQGYKYKQIAEAVDVKVNHVCAIIGKLRSSGRIQAKRYGDKNLQDSTIQRRFTQGYDYTSDQFAESQARMRDLIDLYWTPIPTHEIAKMYGVKPTVIRQGFLKLRMKGQLPSGYHRNSWVLRGNRNGFQPKSNH